MPKISKERREFIKKSVLGTAGAAYLWSSGQVFAQSPNENLQIAIIGLGGRSYALAKAAGLTGKLHVSHACDVDANRMKSFMDYANEKLGYKPEGVRDFREILENKEVDAVMIATPEHWHAPMAIMAMKAGKHVYVEKPCSHNLFENELLVKAYQKYGKVCQMGNQQRSSVTSKKAVEDIRNGIIGEAYYGKAWYANTRGPIGNGKQVPVPDYLDWELWQGPAPREPYRDNVHPYNWHWFKAWGTGEIHNNGTHEIDICRWALNVDLPKKVSSNGGRLHFKGDDWEFFDTQNANFEFDGGKMITWEGKSCNGTGLYERGRGAIIHGTEGTIILDRDGYELYDLKGKLLKYESEVNSGTSSSTSDTTGFDLLTVKHLQNFSEAIKNNAALNSPIDDASISTHLCHLGNISQFLGESLEVDHKTGKVLNNAEAMAMWKREYEKGWEPDL